MPDDRLNKLLRPSSIAVVGASDVPSKVGHTLFRNLLHHGFSGRVYPVNNRSKQIQGMTAYRNLNCLPTVPDLAILTTPAETIPELLESCGKLGIGAAVVISAGFRESGDAGLRLENRLTDVRAAFPQLRILGPNCLGLIVPGGNLNASFGVGMPPSGRVALLSQSGAICTAILDRTRAENIGFSAFISVGNMVDVGFAELLDYFADDPQTDSAVLYMEAIPRGREFVSAARAFSRMKPIVAFKAGRFAESAQAATSHTGAMAGTDAVYDAVFQRTGIVRVFDFEELFDTAELLANKRRPTGPKLTIVTNAGGPGIMAADALLAGGGTLAALSNESRLALDRILPPSWSHNNPIDMLGDASAERYSKTVAAACEPDSDGVLVILTPQAVTDPTATAEAVIAAASETAKPILATWMGRESTAEGMRRLEKAGIPTYSTPERAVRAFLHLAAYSQHLETLTETPQHVALKFPPTQLAAQDSVRAAAKGNHDWLTEENSKAVLEAYGIATARTTLAQTAADAVAAARSLSSPVVLKVASPQITHKTDVGGVRLNLTGDTAVTSAFDEIIASIRQRRPDALVTGVTVQPMVETTAGVELILGLRRDPVFGPVIMIGMGGVTAELIGDRVLELPPLDQLSASRMLSRLRCHELFGAFRGRPPLAVAQLIETMLRFSQMAVDLPEIVECDVNPIVVTPERVIALDARIRVQSIPRSEQDSVRPYPHLAICPYPVELMKKAALPDGMPITIRPIRAEDEPEWLAFLNGCSLRSQHRRFGGLFAATHHLAVRFCYRDYDRELGLVAEVEADGKRNIVGVGRLVSGSDRRQAEFALLIADAWQGRGLGGLLTDACLTAARDRGVSVVTAVTSSDNDPMLRIFAKRGFRLMGDDHGRTMAQLNL